MSKGNEKHTILDKDVCQHDYWLGRVQWPLWTRPNKSSRLSQQSPPSHRSCRSSSLPTSLLMGEAALGQDHGRCRVHDRKQRELPQLLISEQLLSPYFGTWCSRPLVPRQWIWRSCLVDAHATTLGCEEQMSLVQNRKIWAEGVRNKDRRNKG